MKYITIIMLLAFALCAFAQSESKAPEITLKSNVGQPVVGLTTDGEMELLAGSFSNSSYQLAKRNVEVDRPFSFGINSVHPNPFNPTCTIEFEIAEGSEVTFEVYDLLGKQVDMPIERKEMQPGIYELSWTAEKLPSGIYFARLSTGEKTVTKQVVYLK